MFMITYNCRGFNSTKASYIKQLLSQCDVYSGALTAERLIAFIAELI